MESVHVLSECHRPIFGNLYNIDECTVSSFFCSFKLLAVWTSDPTAVIDGRQNVEKRNVYLSVYGLFVKVK